MRNGIGRGLLALGTAGAFLTILRGRLHLPSKSLPVPWPWDVLQESFRGRHYCTFLAPSHLKRLVLGQARP